MNLEDRLRALAPDAAGDWNDVRSRAGVAVARRRRSRLALAFAALALVVAGSAVGARVLDWFAVTEAPVDVPLRPGDVTWISGDVVNVPGGKPQRLSLPLRAPLLGTHAALAVSAPDGGAFVYHAWQDNTPLLVTRNLRTRRERVLARGAQSVAWNRDGRIAWVRRVEPRYSPDGRTPDIGHVVVDGRRWTQVPGPYEVVAWAGSRLLVDVRYCPSCSDDLVPGLYALDGPGPLVPLPLADLAALSPDGRRAIGTHLPTPGQDSPSGLVRLIDVQRGRVLQTLDLRRAFGGGVPPVAGRAAWRDGEIVLTLANRSVLAFFRVGERLRPAGTLRVPRATLPVRYAISYGTPSFVGSGTRRLVLGVAGERTGGGYASAVLTCDRVARRCVRGRLVPPRRWFAVVENPSRP